MPKVGIVQTNDKTDMGYKLKEEHVRLRVTLAHGWIWELVSADGHVAAVSDAYADRDECEAAARTHGLPIIGGRKCLKGKRGPRRPPGVRIFSNGHGLWMWEHVTDDGHVAAASSVRFLTREECERDLNRYSAEGHGNDELAAGFAQSSTALRAAVEPTWSNPC